MAEIDGLYKADFITPTQRGFGILVISQGSARGGDSIMSYDGKFASSGSEVTIDLEVCRHSHLGTLTPIFKTDSVRLSIAGKRLEDGRIAGTGQSPEAPDVPMKVILTKLRN